MDIKQQYKNEDGEISPHSETFFAPLAEGHLLEVIKNNNSLIFFCSSNVSHVTHIITEAICFFESENVESHIHCQVVLRELLLNAIIHGNKNKPEKSVFGLIKITESRNVIITVIDSGEGFQFNNLDLTLPINYKKIQNRGLTIVNTLSKQLKYNNKGNRVTATLSEIQSENETHEDNIVFQKSMINSR